MLNTLLRLFTIVAVFCPVLTMTVILVGQYSKPQLHNSLQPLPIELAMAGDVAVLAIATAATLVFLYWVDEYLEGA